MSGPPHKSPVRAEDTWRQLKISSDFGDLALRYVAESERIKGVFGQAMVTCVPLCLLSTVLLYTCSNSPSLSRQWRLEVDLDILAKPDIPEETLLPTAKSTVFCCNK